MKKKICFITATREDYFLLSGIMKKVEEHPDFQLQIVATGTHLSPESDFTYENIEADGFTIEEKVEMQVSSDTPEGMAKSMGLAMMSFPSVFQRLQPDLVLVLGDRYELFAVASVAHMLQLPLAHLYGGEKTEGVSDEVLSHAITKLSYLHFTALEDHKNRVIQLGEEPERVFQVGSMGVETMLSTSIGSKEALEEQIDFSLGEHFALVSFHPVSVENNPAKDQFQELLLALEEFPDLKVLFIKANPHGEGRMVNEMMEKQVAENPEKYGCLRAMDLSSYVSAMNYCDFVLGNSSSGLTEAPSLKKPTINVGDRQKGRKKAKSVIDCLPKQKNITNAMKVAQSPSFVDSIQTVVNPFGDGTTSQQIMTVFEAFFQEESNCKKTFYDVTS